MNFEVPLDWCLNPENKESKKLNEIVSAHARRLKAALAKAEKKEEKKAAVHAFYRKFYTLTLCKSCVEAGINRSPTRDIILDFPWKDLHEDRFQCLKIWEKINK